MTIAETGAAKAMHLPAFRAYAKVRLSHEVRAGGVAYPAGTHGVIVHCHGDGIGYEVEVESPAFRVLTLTARDLIPDHG